MIFDCNFFIAQISIFSERYKAFLDFQFVAQYRDGL